MRCVTLATARCATEMRVCRRWPAPPRASASQHFHKPICSPKTAVVIFPRCARISAVVVVVVFGAITRQKADVKWRVLLVCPYASSRSPLGGIYVVCDLWRPTDDGDGGWTMCATDIVRHCTAAPEPNGSLVHERVCVQGQTPQTRHGLAGGQPKRPNICDIRVTAT